MAPAFLEEVVPTEDGYLYLKSYPSQKKSPLVLPNSLALWKMLHAPVENVCRHPGAPNNEAPDPFELQALQKTRVLMEAIKRSLGEMEQMKDGKDDRSMRLSVNRLKKQQTARLSQASPEASQIVVEQAYLDATLRAIRTLNSIRALSPLLIRMFHHEQRKNSELEMTVTRNEEGQVTETVTLEALKKKGGRQGKALVWLIGDYVYDTTSAHHLNQLNNGLWRILECFLPDKRQYSKVMDLKDLGDKFWFSFMPEFVENQKARKHVLPPSRLFARLSLEQQQVVHDIAKSCDERYLHAFHHENEETHQTRILYQAAVDKLINNLRIVLQKHRRFRDSDVRVYGSCLSNLALGKSSDVDISFHLPPFAHLKYLFETGQVDARQYERDMKGFVFSSHGILSSQRARSNGFVMYECITRARVPVIKGTYLYAGNPFSVDGSLDFDICFSNEIAVVNSALLSEYTLVDERVKRFLLAIKAWAKLYGISSAADSRISSYAWVNMGIFYLQCLGFVPNLQCRELMVQHGFQRDPRNWSHQVDALDTCFVPWGVVATQSFWKQPEEWRDTPVTLLLYGFFHFYAKHFPKTLFSVSMREGSIMLPKTTFEKVSVQNLCIEDPFETHGSHTPHDLGRPAGETGHIVIAKALSDSEKYLRGLLTGENKEESSFFWRLTEVTETPPANHCNSFHDNLQNTPVPDRNNDRSNQSSKKGRPGGMGGRGKGHAGRGPASTRGNQVIDRRKSGANNPFQKKAAMQSPRKNGVNRLMPNNKSQGENRHSDETEANTTDSKGSGKRPSSLRSKKNPIPDASKSGVHPAKDRSIGKQHESLNFKPVGDSDDKESTSSPPSGQNRNKKSPRGVRPGRGDRAKQSHAKKHNAANGCKESDSRVMTAVVKEAEATRM